MTENIIYSKEPEDFRYMEKNIPCQFACPADTNIPGYIQKLYEGRHDLSYEINQKVNILPGVLGRICSRPCEEMCRHGEDELGDPVNICHIKRAASDFINIEHRATESCFSGIRKKVAIIGSGPSGLAAARDLCLMGFEVTVYEAFDSPGGMLRYGIPEFRLPRNVLDSEINNILGLGVTLKTGIKVGEHIRMEDLVERHDAVLIAAGCMNSNLMNIEGRELSGIYTGLQFMIDVCSGKPPVLGKNVLVVGAGFTAFDCARSALRTGAENVSICLRRTEQDLTVTKDEISETRMEGVKINSLTVASRIVGSGRVKGVEFLRTRPDPLTSDGKKDILAIPGSEFVLDADSIIVATGQHPAYLGFSGRDIRARDVGTFLTDIPNVYCTGDYVTGPSTVIEAIADGRKAAWKIAEDLTGRKHVEKIVQIEEARITHRKRSWDFIPRETIPTIVSIGERLKKQSIEVETGFTKEQAHEESKRCYLCNLHYEIDIGRCIYCRYCIDLAPRDCIKMVKSVRMDDTGAINGYTETTVWNDVNAIMIDNTRCIRCGECVRICPMDCISVSRVELKERMTFSVNGDPG